MYRGIALLVLALLLTACAGPSQVPLPPATATPSLPGQEPSGTPAPAPAATARLEPPQPGSTHTPVPDPASTSVAAKPPLVPSFSHVFIIVMENKETGAIVGSKLAPYINSLASQYGQAANYYAISHPSLPNYLALTGGRTFGVTTDCTNCFQSEQNIVDMLEKGGKTWKAYMESMPQPCYLGADTSLYVRRHNPLLYYDDVRNDAARCKNIVPLTQLDADLQTNSVPDYVWIAPNLCHAMHDCPVSSGDDWLRTWVQKIQASSAWQDNSVLFLTFDEGTSNAGCCDYAAGGKITTLVISKLVKPGFVSQVQYDHYSLLRTIQESWGLFPLLGHAACDCSAPMRDFFAPP